MSSKTVLSLACVTLFGAALASGGPISFNQCPAVGTNTLGCELLVTIFAVNGSGLATSWAVTTASPDQGPYDGNEDTLIGIQNNSGGVFKSIRFTNVSNAGTGAFAFETDGACTTIGCTNGAGDTTGYGGPGITYSAITGAISDNGTVNYAGGLANGGHAWFSLEEQISGQVLQGGVPEPGSVVLMGAGLVGLLLFARRRLAC